MPRLRDHALSYAILGWAVFPLWPGRKAPHGYLVPNGFHDATTDLYDIERWWDTCPTAGIGVSCQTSKLLVVDVDPRNGGYLGLARLEHELGSLPATVRAKTAGGGIHEYFKQPRDTRWLSRLGDGVDLKSKGYVVAPPSLGPDGGTYQWQLSPDYNEVAVLPAKWQERAVRGPLRGIGQRDDGNPSQSGGMALRAVYEALTGKPGGEWVLCPFHDDSNPSMKLEGGMWTCFVCDPLSDKEVCGGNALDFAGMYWKYPMPLSGVDVSECKARLEQRMTKLVANEWPDV